MKLDSYEIKSAMMDARWDEAAMVLDRHFGLSGLVAALVARNSRFRLSAIGVADYVVIAYVKGCAEKAVGSKSYYYGWNDEDEFKCWGCSTKESKIIFYVPRDLYIKIGMIV